MNASDYLPGNARLLRGVRDRLAELSAAREDAELRWALQAADVALNELMLRENGTFFAAFQARLHTLLGEGVRLASGLPEADAAAEQLAGLPAQPDARLGFATLGAAIAGTLACGETLVRAASRAGSPSLRQWVSRLVALEAELHAYRTQQAPRPVVASGRRRSPPTRDELQAYLQRRFPERPDIAVTDFRILVGGFQKFTILFDMHSSAGGTETCVMRAEHNERFVDLDAGEVTHEFDIVRMAQAAGVPVAEPLWLEPDASQLGRRFFVTRKVEGVNCGSAMAMDTPLSAEVLRSFVAAIAAIHRVPVDAAMRRSALGHWLAHPDLAANTRASVQGFMGQRFMQGATPSPAVARLCSWLLENVPQEDAPACFIHVDIGPHNILVHGDRVAAVLDWESARIGDPAEDLSSFIGNMRGQVDAAQALAWYAACGGAPISEYRLRYFDVYNLLKTLACCASTTTMFEREPQAAVEWCLLALPYSHSVVRLIEEKIAVAEAVARHRQ